MTVLHVVCCDFIKSKVTGSLLYSRILLNAAYSHLLIRDIISYTVLIDICVVLCCCSQCQVPMFVATKLARIKSASLFVASPSGYARAAVAAIGYEVLTLTLTSSSSSFFALLPYVTVCCVVAEMWNACLSQCFFFFRICALTCPHRSVSCLAVPIQWNYDVILMHVFTQKISSNSA